MPGTSGPGTNGSLPPGTPGAAGGWEGQPGGGAQAGVGGRQRAAGGVPNFRSGGGPGGGILSPPEIAWLESERTTEKWLIAVSSSMQASIDLIAGKSIMPMGGFNGGDPAMTRARLVTLVEKGELRFIASSAGSGRGGIGNGAATTLASTVCAPVSARTWGGIDAVAAYDCRGKAAELKAAAALARLGHPAKAGAHRMVRARQDPLPPERNLISEFARRA